MLGQILYFIVPSEVNARVAELAGYLYDSIEDNVISDPHKALSIIKTSDIYKNYINIGEWINAIYNGKLKKEVISELCNEYNKIYLKDYTEYKIKKLLFRQYNETMKKIESSIGKMCVKYVKNLKIR